MPHPPDRGDATRSALVARARALFAAQGFAGTSIEEILGAAGVSRGALYHHFRSKEELFHAVYEAVEADLGERILLEAMTGADPLERLRLGLHAFLDACLGEEVQRVVLVEGPTVLGWEVAHAIDEQYGYGLVKAGVDEAMEAGFLERQAAVPLAHLLFGALCQAGMVLARDPDPVRARTELAAAIDRLLEGLRSRP